MKKRKGSHQKAAHGSFWLMPTTNELITVRRALLPASLVLALVLMRPFVIPITMLRTELLVNLSMTPAVDTLAVRGVMLIAKVVMNIIAFMLQLVMLTVVLILIAVGVAIVLRRSRGRETKANNTERDG